MQTQSTSFFSLLAQLRWPKILVLIVGVISLVAVLPACKTDPIDPVNLTNRIGVYFGDGAYEDHAVAVQAALDSLGWSADALSSLDIQNGVDDYAVLIFAAGNPRIMVDALGFVGLERVRDLVQRGGGFIGLGAGAYLAADTLIYDGVGSAGTPPLGFFNGRATGPIASLAPAGSRTMALVHLTDTRFDPDLIGNISSLYRGGPEWVVSSPPYISMGTFTQTGGEAGLTLTYGFGRVGLLAFQPEIDEDNPRDGTTVGDELDDPESEWFLLNALVEWCLRDLD